MKVFLKNNGGSFSLFFAAGILAAAVFSFLAFRPVSILANFSNITTSAVADLTPDLVTPNQLKVPLMTFTVNSSDANEEFQRIKVQYTGTDKDDIAVVYLYKESVVSGGAFDASTDIQMKSDSSPTSGGEFDLNPTNMDMNQNTDYQFYIVADIKGTAVIGHSVDVKIKKDKITFKSGNWPSAADESLFDPAGNSLIAAEPTLTVNKILIPGTDAGKFSLKIDDSTAGTGADVGDGGATGAIGVTIGAHVVSETAGQNTNLSDYISVINGDCDALGNVSLSAGENKICTITNTKKGKIIVEKQTNPGGSLQNFSFETTYGSNFPLSDDGQNDSGFLTPNTYRVTENNVSGWGIVSTVCSDGSDPSSIALDPGEVVTCVFTNMQLGEIRGIKFNDLNGNGIKDQGEPGVSGWTINASDGETTHTAVTVSDDPSTQDADETGTYRFMNLPAGTYTVREGEQSGWYRTTQNPAPIEIQVGTVAENVDFGNFKKVTITGFKWDDRNADGTWQKEGDAKEPGLADTTIKLQGVHASFASCPIDTEMVQLNLTGTDGSFSLNTPCPGQYRITEEVPHGWRQRAPRDSFFDVFVNISGEEIREGFAGGKQLGEITNSNSVPLEFGNAKYSEVLGGKFVSQSGDGSSTPSAILLDAAVVTIPVSGGASTVSLAKGTVVTRVDGSRFDVSALTGSSVDAGSLSGLGAGVVIDNALQWGIVNFGLSFNPAIMLNIFVGTALNGQTLNVTRSISGTGGWTNDGIVPPATCVVSQGICAFSATKASYYAATHTISAPAPDPAPAQGTSIPNDITGGIGGASVLLPPNIVIPLEPLPSPRGREQILPSSPEGGASVFIPPVSSEKPSIIALAAPQLSPLPPAKSFIQSQAPEEGSAASNAQGSKSSAETVTPEPLEKNQEISQLPDASELQREMEKPEAGGFMAAIGNTLNNLTGTTGVVALALLTVLGLAGYWIYASSRQ